MMKNKSVRRRAIRASEITLCGEYTTNVSEASVLGHLRLRLHLHIKLHKLRWTVLAANYLSPGTDNYKASLVKYHEMRAAEA